MFILQNTFKHKLNHFKGMNGMVRESVSYTHLEPATERADAGTAGISQEVCP